MSRGKKLPTSIASFGCIYRPQYRDRNGQGRQSTIWVMKYRPAPGAKPIIRSTRTADQQAAFAELTKLASRYASGELLGASPERVTFNQLFGLLEADYRKRKLASLDDMLGRVNKHLRPRFGKMRVLDLRKRDVEHFVASRVEGYTCVLDDGSERTERLEPASVNKLIAYLRRAMKLGTREDPPLVLRIPDWFQKLDEDNTRTGIISAETYRAVRDELSPHARLVWVIGYHTGMRRGAILGLRWEWVDLDAGVITIPPSQNRGNPTKKKPRIVPIYGEMRACLEMAQAERDRDCPDCKWVVQYGGARVNDIKTAFHAACERVGIKGSVLIHDLRRTALTNMEEAGVPRHIAMTISGHKTESAYRRYLIGRERSVIEAGRTMEQWMHDRETEQRSAKKPS